MSRRNEPEEVEVYDDSDEHGNDPVGDEIAQHEESILGDTYADQTQQKQIDMRSQLQYQTHLITPDAKETYRDIDKDMVTANLNEPEVIWVKLRERYAGDVDYLMKKGIILDNLFTKIKRSVYIALNVSLSREGFLRKELGTARTKFGREEQQQRPRLPFGYKK